jgi:NCS1 family nucleobase:cation symporter-1
VLGPAIGLPPTMTLFAFIGIATTCASVLIFGKAIWDPVQLVGRFSSPTVVAAAMFAIALATLSTNIAANVVSPSNDFANLWPARISFKRGGLITGFVGIVILPWRLYTDLADYIFTWLIGYSTLLGAIAGIMLIDYYVIRRRHLDVAGLYNEHGPYIYRRGYNSAALFALAVGIIPTLPGFLAQASKGVIHVPVVFGHLYAYGWFVSLALAGTTYMVLMLRKKA